MYHLRPVLLLLPLVLLRCVATAPNNRYFSSSSRYQGSVPPDQGGWLVPELVSNPFLSLMSARTQRELTVSNGHHRAKRRCNTATCVTQRLADFLVRSSNTLGTVYAPTNVDSNTYGKRDLLQLPSFLPL